jgi:hypothetical protein
VGEEAALERAALYPSHLSRGRAPSPLLKTLADPLPHAPVGGAGEVSESEGAVGREARSQGAVRGADEVGVGRCSGKKRRCRRR